jgi:hypothetical protein
MRLAGKIPTLRTLVAGAMFFVAALGHSGAQTYLNAQLPWHPVELDAQGKVLAWYHPEKNLGYDQFLRLDWDMLEHKIPIDNVTKVKVYLTAPIFDGKTLQGVNWQHNPASTYAHLMDNLQNWYPYSGDAEAIGVMREMFDYQLAHGMTPADWDWAGVAFPTACLHDKEYGTCIQDMPHAFYGGIESDKVGEMGLAFVHFYEMTGDEKYLKAGIQAADQLAKHVSPGDSSHTPWAFRIDAHSGGAIAGEVYGGMVVASVRLFDELIRLKEPHAGEYQRARDTAWHWMLTNPLDRTSAAFDRWTGYYEDISKDTLNENDMNSMMTAQYILDRENPASVDPKWKEDVGYLLDRSRALLGRGPFFGAWAIDEQLRPDGGARGPSTPERAFIPPGGALLFTSGRGCCSRAGLVCRTAQWGAINAMYAEKTHDGQAREDAFRSLNYATYFADSEGRIAAAGTDYDSPYWFEDGYSDAGRSFTWAMGAIPDFAPKKQDHLLRSSSVVKKVTYAPGKINFETFDPESFEVLRLSFKPTSVMAGTAKVARTKDLSGEGYTVKDLDGGDYEVRIHHLQAHELTISSR